MNTKIERKFYCFLMKISCVETNYKNLYGWGIWAVIADHYVAFFDETSLNICVGQAHMGKYQIQHFFKVTKEKLLETWKKILPRLWQNFIQYRTADRIAKSGVLNILSVEDNQTSSDALEYLLAQYSFILTTHCSTVI